MHNLNNRVTIFMNIIVTKSYSMAIYVTLVIIHHLLDVEDSYMTFFNKYIWIE